jgi:hypothetical protein
LQWAQKKDPNISHSNYKNNSLPNIYLIYQKNGPIAIRKKIHPIKILLNPKKITYFIVQTYQDNQEYDEAYPLTQKNASEKTLYSLLKT